MPNHANKVVIVGGGLVGSLWSLYLLKNGYEVEVYEKRPDMRKVLTDGGRSINLVMTSRGLNALSELNILEEILHKTVPVYGRMMHSIEGQLAYQAYGINNSECNYSVSRLELNKTLITLAEKAGAKFFFEHEVINADFENKIVNFKTKNDPCKQVKAQCFFGADGAGSVIRKELAQILKSQNVSFQNEIFPLGADYKELFLPTDQNKLPAMEKNVLHIWPRGDHMLMALPNLDGSFTMTLYLQTKGEKSFESLKDIKEVERLFKEEFKDSIPLMPNYLKDYFENPTGKLATVKCRPWHYKGSIALIGDAAHAVVPFFGQGMNAGFEDCSVLNNLMQKNNKNDWHKIFSAYSDYQKPNGDAIADMAVENYNEMSSLVADAKFQLQKQIEQVLRSEFPHDFKNRYALVTYSLVPYHHVKKIGEIQKDILCELSKDIETIEKLNLSKARKLLEEKLFPYQKSHSIIF